MKTFKRLLFIIMLGGLSSCVQTPLIEQHKNIENGEDDLSVIDVKVSPYEQLKSPINQQANSLFTKAEQAVENDDLVVAINLYTQLAEQYPQYSGPLLNLAIIYNKQNNSTQAEQYFKKTLSVNKLNLRAYSAYGAFLRNEGRFLEAEKVYLTGLSLWDDVPATHKNLAILYDLYMGKFEQAYSHYQRYLELLEQTPENQRNDKEIKQVNGWLIDLQRRIASKSAN